MLVFFYLMIQCKSYLFILDNMTYILFGLAFGIIGFVLGVIYTKQQVVQKEEMLPIVSVPLPTVSLPIKTSVSGKIESVKLETSDDPTTWDSQYAKKLILNVGLHLDRVYQIKDSVKLQFYLMGEIGNFDFIQFNTLWNANLLSSSLMITLSLTDGEVTEAEIYVGQ